MGLVIWKEVPGPVRVLGTASIVVGGVVLNTVLSSPKEAPRPSSCSIHQSAWKGTYQKSARPAVSAPAGNTVGGLELLDERRFGNGMVYLRHRTTG